MRIPVQLPVTTKRWRVVIRNINYRTSRAHPGRVKFHSVAVGGVGRNQQGRLTPQFVPTKEFAEGLQIIASEVDVANLGVGWTSDWQSIKLIRGVDYLVSYGYTTGGQNVQRNIGSGWQTTGSPEHATRLHDELVTYTRRQPFDVRIEYETSAASDIVFGDSIATGSNSTFPVFEAPLAIANRANARATRLSAFGGAGFAEFAVAEWGRSADSPKWQEITSYGSADRAFIALGNNDISAGAGLEALQERTRKMIELIQERVSEHIVVCTVTPRSAWVNTQKECVRSEFNDWLLALPDGVTAVAETAAAVQGSDGHTPRDDLYIGDGVHFNSEGAAALAEAMQHVS